MSADIPRPVTMKVKGGGEVTFRYELTYIFYYMPPLNVMNHVFFIDDEGEPRYVFHNQQLFHYLEKRGFRVTYCKHVLQEEREAYADYLASIGVTEDEISQFLNGLDSPDIWRELE